MKYILFILFLFLNIINGLAQNFSIVYGSSSYFTSTTYHRGIGIAFGDFDNDNDLDLIIIGKDTIPTRIYKNNGQGVFTPFTYNLPKATMYYNYIISDVKWFDYNNDGLLDLLFFNTSSKKIKVYKNTGNANNPFTLVYNFNYYFNPTGCGYADLYQNGLQDIYCLASNNGNRLLKNKSNVSSNIFVLDYLSATNTPNAGVWFMYSSIFDANKDGISDIYVNLMGEQGACYFTGITENPKIELHSELGSDAFFNSLPVDLNGNGNYNIITETSGNSSILEFQNDTIILILANANFSVGNHMAPALQFFDYNNDGKIDIYCYPNFYNNNGNLSFTYSSYNYSINSKPIIADVDNDKDLDFFAVSADTSYIFKNLCTTPNTLPTAPQILWTTMDSTKVIFHWLPATDAETPQPSLSYNLMVGTSSKSIDITSPLSDTVTGFRRVVEAGNAFLNNFYILDKSNFTLGDTVYWSVQTIDNGFGYSPFSKESSAIIVGKMEAHDFDTICGGDSVFWRGAYYTNSFTDYYGLDSAFVLTLKVHPSYLDKQDVDICSGSTYTWKGNTYYNSGIYNIQHYTSQGCDSVERLVLNVRPDYTTLLIEDICMGDSLLFAGKHLKSSGVYWDTLSSIYACDSLLELTLSVYPADTSIILSGDTLYATPQNASFRWWNCDKQEFVYAANQSYFAPFQNGHYAAEISSNGCSFLTQCYEITGLSIDDTGIPDLEVNLMPNPNDGEFYLELKVQGKQKYQILIFDALGKEIYNQQIEFENYKKLKLNLTSEVSGVYQLRIVSRDGIISRRFIIR
ncbi:MAG: hypothetical protein DRI84_10365 [Bacteroidetes bacterium]|nr:MAG: hypothetical protein DRI84_10365 [Bacteroidota bacterium]